jgi:hypothetical protein
MTRTLSLAAVATALAIVAAGCGGSSSGTSTTTTATQSWANGVCSALSTWKSSVAQTKSTLANPAAISKDTLTSAVDSVDSATKTLRQSLTGLSKPQALAGGQAADTVETLRGQLTSEWSSIQKSVATSSQPLATVSSVTGTLATMGAQVQAAVGDLKQLDPKGEVDQAFQTAPACEPFLRS